MFPPSSSSPSAVCGSVDHAEVCGDCSLISLQSHLPAGLLEAHECMDESRDTLDGGVEKSREDQIRARMPVDHPLQVAAATFCNCQPIFSQQVTRVRFPLPKNLARQVDRMQLAHFILEATKCILFDAP